MAALDCAMRARRKPWLALTARWGPALQTAKVRLDRDGHPLMAADRDGLRGIPRGTRRFL